MDRFDLEAAREGIATRKANAFRPHYARRRQTCCTSRKGVNNVFGGNGGELRHAKVTGIQQIPAR